MRAGGDRGGVEGPGQPVAGGPWTPPGGTRRPRKHTSGSAGTGASASRWKVPPSTFTWTAPRRPLSSHPPPHPPTKEATRHHGQSASLVRARSSPAQVEASRVEPSRVRLASAGECVHGSGWTRDDGPGGWGFHAWAESGTRERAAIGQSGRGRGGLEPSTGPLQLGQVGADDRGASTAQANRAGQGTD